MSNADIDYIESELRKITSAAPKTWPPPARSTHYYNIYTRLELLRTVPPPPPTTTYGARSLPQGPFTDHTAALTYRMGSDGSGTFGSFGKQHIHDTPDYGLQITQWQPASAAPKGGVWTVIDTVGERIGNTPPTSDGTAEAGIWFGVPANSQRLLGHGTCMGFWLGGQHTDSIHQDWTAAVLNADGTLGKLPAHGIYIEHCARRVKIEYATIRAAARGITVEWWYPDPGNAAILSLEYPAAAAGQAGSLDVEIAYCDIEADTIGISLESGVCGYHIHDCKITAPVGISHPANLAIPSMPNLIDWPTIEFHGQTLEAIT